GAGRIPYRQLKTLGPFQPNAKIKRPRIGSTRPVPSGCGSIHRPIVVAFCGREWTLQFLANADLHPSDYASAGNAGPLAANDSMVLVGCPCFGLAGHGSSRAAGSGRSAVT